MRSFSDRPRGRGRGFKRKREDSPHENNSYQAELEVYSQSRGRGKARGRARNAKGRAAFGSSHRSRGKAYSSTHLKKYTKKGYKYGKQVSNFQLDDDISPQNTEMEDFEAHSYGVEVADEIYMDSTNHSDNDDDNDKDKIKVKLIRSTDVQLKVEDNNTEDAVELFEEILYVPDTRDLASSLVKAQLQQKISSIKDLAGFNLSLETKGEQMFFLIKHNDDHKLQEAKKKIVALMQSVVAEMRDPAIVPTSDEAKADAIDHSTSENANNSGTDLTPLQASSEDFLSLMSSGGPESDDQPVYGFLTNIPRGVVAKDLHSAIIDNYRKKTNYSGPDFPFLSMFNFVDRSLPTKFCAAKFPSRKILKDVIKRCNRIKRQTFTAYITQVPPDDPKIKVMADCIRTVLQASISTALVQRPQGVFPAGVQPDKVVVVVDDAICHLNVEEIRKKGYDVLTGSNLDVHGFFELIASDDHYKKDGVLYVVQPGMDFFLKNMKAMDLEVADSEESESLVADPKKFANHLSTLIKNNFERSLHQKKNPSNDIFNFSSESLAVLNKCDLSKLCKLGEFSCSATSNESCHEDLVQENLPPCNNGPANEVSNNEENCLSPSDSNKEDEVPMSGHLHTFLSRALHLAQALRNMIIVNTLNSEVVFLGCPVEWLLADEAAKVFPKMPEISLKHLAGSLIASLRLFNIFAAKTWKLGGFPSLNFNNDPAVSVEECVHETKKPGIKSRLGALVVPESVDGAASDKKAPEETNKESKDESIIKTTGTEDYTGERSAEDLVNCLDDALIYEENADDNDEDGDDTRRSKFVSEKYSSKSIYPDDTVVSSEMHQTETEVIDLDGGDEEELLYELESEGDAIECLDVEAIAAAAAKITPSTGTSRDSREDFMDLSQLKQVCVINRDVTADVTRVLDFVTEHYKINGSFAPWTPIKGAPCSPSSHLSLVKEYVQKAFYTKVKQYQGPDMYMCTAVCASRKLMDAEDAETHAFTRCHITRLANLGKKGPPPARPPARHLLFEAMKKCGTPVAPDQIENLVKLGIVEQLEIGGKQHFKCLVCPKLPEPCYGVSLRKHLHSYTHTQGLIKFLGAEGCLTVPIIENWQTVKRALRYSAMDVVIVADNMHRPTLTAFIDMHPQVHVITTNNLIYDGAAPGRVFSQWREIEKAQKFADRKPAHTLFLVVTGKDLLTGSSQASSAAKTSSDLTYEQAKGEMIPEEEVIVIKEKEDFVHQSGSGDEAIKSSEEQQNVQWNNLLQHMDKAVKESVTSLVKLHSYFRIQLPVNCKVLVAPLLPLTVLPDTTPQPAKTKIMQNKHTVVVPPHLTQAIAKAYSNISEEIYSIHKANSVHENLPHVDKSLALENVEVAEGRHCLLSSQWHVSVEEIVINALHGMPSVIPNFTAEDEIDIKPLGLHTNLYHGVVVGDYAEWIQHTTKSNNKYTGYSGRGMSMFARDLRFHQADMDFILEKAQLFAEEDDNKSFVWYLTCPIPEILFYPKECKMCIDSDCDTPLKVWSPANVHRYKCDNESLDIVSHNALVKVSKFLTLLQSKLPPKHFVTLFPIFPTNIVSFGSINSTVHDEMHKLQYDVPRTIFSPMPVTEVLKPIAIRFANGWLELFRKVHLGHTESFDPRGFKSINVQHIRMNARSLAHNSMKAAEFWLSAVSSLIQDHHIKFEVEIAPEIAAWIQGERSGPSLALSELSRPGELKSERADCRELLNRIKRHDHQEPPAFIEHQPSFYRVDEGSHGRMGPHGRSCSPGDRSKSPQFGGPPIRRDCSAPYLVDPVDPPPFMRCDRPRMRSRSPFQRRNSPQVQSFDPAAMRSRSPFHMNTHPRSRSPSHGSRNSMRLDDQPHHMRFDNPPHHMRSNDPPHHMRSNDPPHHVRLNDPPHNRDYPPNHMQLNHPPHHMRVDGPPHQNLESRDYDRPHSSRERRLKSPEKQHYSPRRVMDCNPSRHFPGEGHFSNSTERRSPSMDRNRFSPGSQHSSRGRFHPCPPQTRISPDCSERSRWESSFSKTAAPFGGAPGGPATSQFGFTIATASREPLSQHWINKLAWALKISAQPTLGSRGTWRIQAPSARVLFGAQRFLPAMRLVDQQLIVAVETSQSAVVPVTSLEEEELYRQRLEFVVRCYNDNHTPKLVSLLMNDTAATFFRPGWKHLYTPDLSRTIPLVADAMRSLNFIPRSEAGSVRLLVVTPSADAVGVMMRVLQTVARPLGITVVPIIHGKEDAGPGMTVVVGAAIPLAQVCPGLILQDLSALVVDDASIFLDDPTPNEALRSILYRIGTRTRDYSSVNKVAVAREDTAAERLRMEAMLECVFAGGCGPPQQPQPRMEEGVGSREDPWLQQVHEMQEQFQSYLQKQKGPLPPPQAQFQERSQQEQFISRPKQFGSEQDQNERQHKQFNPRHEQFKDGEKQWESSQNQFEHQQEKFGSWQNPFKTRQEQSESKQNQSKHQQEQLGPRQNRFDLDQDKFGYRQNQFKPEQEQFGSRQNRSKPQQEPFGTRQNQVQPQPEQFGYGENQIEPQHEKFESRQNQFKPQQNQFGSRQEQSGSKQNNFQPQQEQFGSKQDRFEPRQEKFGSGQNQFKPQQNQFESRQEQSGSKQNNFQPQQEQFGSKPDRFEPRQEKFGSGQNQFKPQQEEFGSRRNISKPHQEEFGSRQNQFKLQLEEVGSQQDQFELRQNQFKFQQEQSGSKQNQFKSQQEQFAPKPNRFEAQQEKFGARQNQSKSQQEQYDHQLEKFKAQHEQFMAHQKQSTSLQAPCELMQQQQSNRLLPRSMTETSPQARGQLHQHSQEALSQGSQFGHSSFMQGRQETSSSGDGSRLTQRISDFLERRKAGAADQLVNPKDAADVVSLEYLSNLKKTQLEQVPKVLLRELYATLFKDKLNQRT